jgi:hypothetical protein
MRCGRRRTSAVGVICRRSEFEVADPLRIALPGLADERRGLCLRSRLQGLLWKLCRGQPPICQASEFLKGYGQQVNKVGEVADLFAPDVPLFDRTDPDRKIIHSWKRTNSDITSEARIEKVLPDFYYVTVSVYDGPTSCGIDEFRLKGPKTTLRGYVPRTGPHDVPSLWKFRHMSGLC